MKWLLSLFAWRLVREVGTWRYYENRVTGEREARWIGGCYSPVNGDWLARREPRAMTPPNTGSAARK